MKGKTEYAMRMEQMIDDLEDENGELENELLRLRGALEKIASCESVVPGDVVSIAQEALK